MTLTVHDINGTQVGQGSGILIAPRLVLTSAHLVAGKSRWSVTSADGTVKSAGIRGMTYDWMDYDNSQKAHPRKHDVAVIYLDKPINLDVYPKVASEKLANGATGTRLRSSGSQVLQLPQTFKKVVGFPHAYLTDMPSQEQVEPGNAVLNEHNEIVGVVTGRGLTTGQMYVARTNDLTDWLSPKAQCGGRKNASVRTYGTPPPKPGCDTPGNGSSSGASGQTSSGASSGASGESSSGSSGASSGASGQTSSGASGQSSGTSGTSGQSSGTSGTSGESSSGASSSGGTDNPSCHDGGGHCQW
ncbi:MAG: S1C family serine protease [Labilithrix sp.]